MRALGQTYTSHLSGANSELKIKEDLVQAYRILGHLGLDDHTYTHLSYRSTLSPQSFYIYHFGLRFEEVTVENLLRINVDGVIEEGYDEYCNRTGYVIHGEIYKARPDIQCIFHIHTPEMVAVSALENGLLPISQWALHFYNNVAYHSYKSLALEAEQGKQISKDLEDKMVMLLRHHGAILCGRTIQEAMFYTYHLQQACKTQCLILAMNQPVLPIPQDVCRQAVHDLLSFEKNLGDRDWKAWVRLTSGSIPSA